MQHRCFYAQVEDQGTASSPEAALPRKIAQQVFKPWTRNPLYIRSLAEGCHRRLAGNVQLG